MNRRQFAVNTALAAVLVRPEMLWAATSSQTFVETAAIAGMFEIDSSKVALEKTKSDGIRSFADRMIADHTKAAEELVGIAKGKYDVPAAMDAKHQKLMEKLRKSSAAHFDMNYVKMQTTAHEEAVKLFGDYAKNGDDPALKDFAAKTLPTLEEHYSMIKAIAAKMAS